jgi:hypothetical protein
MGIVSMASAFANQVDKEQHVKVSVTSLIITRISRVAHNYALLVPLRLRKPKCVWIPALEVAMFLVPTSVPIVANTANSAVERTVTSAKLVYFYCKIGSKLVLGNCEPIHAIASA